MPYIAAMLTVVGYSINVRVVVFDQLSENMKERKPQTPAELRTLVNDGLSQMSFRALFTLATVVVGAICCSSSRRSRSSPSARLSSTVCWRPRGRRSS